MRPFTIHFFSRTLVYQHKNGTKHKSKHAMTWSKRRHANILDCPSRSTNLNIVKQWWKERSHHLVGAHDSHITERFVQM